VKTFLIHGFNVSDGGRGSVGKFAPFLSEPVLFDYGWTFLLGVRLFNDNRARRLVREIGQEEVSVIAHSNGNTIALMAAEMGAPIRNIVGFNPALDVDAKLPPQVKRFDVFHATNDLTAFFAIPLIKSRWGGMMRYGYRGRDPRWVNWTMNEGERWQWDENLARRVRGAMQTWEPEFAANGHSGWHGREVWPYWRDLGLEGKRMALP